MVRRPERKIVKVDSAAEGLSRPDLLILAQKVFENSSMKCSPAFAQFRMPDHLRDIINAKREGVFDYGACVIETEEEVQYPPCDIVMDVLDRVLADGPAEDMMEELGLEEGDFSRVFPGTKKGKKAGRKSKKETKPEEPEQTAEAPEEEEAEEQPPPKKRRQLRQKTKEPEPEPEAEEAGSDLVDISAILEPINDLRKDLGDVLEGQDKKFTGELKALGEAIDSIMVGLAAIAEMVNAVYITVGDHYRIADPNAELAEVDESVYDKLERLVGTDSTPAEEPAGEEQQDLDWDYLEKHFDEKQINRMTEEAAAKIIENGWTADDCSILKNGDVKYTGREESDNGKPDDTISLTKDDLQKMNIQELRDLAAKLGIDKAGKASYKKPLIQKILAASEG
jgi:hypothetical protein